MMKKVCCTILCVCLLASLIGCGSADEAEETTTTAAETEATTTAEGSSFEENVSYTVHTTDNRVIVKFENQNDSAAFISKTNVSFYDESSDLIDTETMDAVFVDADSINYGQVTYYGEYASVAVVPYITESDEVFDCNDAFEIAESSDEEISELYLTITNTGDMDASAMLTVVYYKDGEIFYVAPDVGEIMLYAGDSEEVTIDLPHNEDYSFLEYDSKEILVIGYGLGTSTEAEIAEDDSECAYNVEVYADEYIEIELVSVATDNAYFSITNVSDRTIQVSAEYIQLDDMEYTYEDTNYSTPILLIVSGDTLDYEFCDYDTGNEIDFEIINPDFDIFSGVFEILDEDGTSLEYATITDISVK